MTQKKAFERPETGVYYLVPDPKTGKYSILSQYDRHDADSMHLFLWDQVVKMLRMRFKKSLVESISDSYRGLPRGRIVYKNDEWIVAHGEDFPMSEYKHDIISEFNLGDADHIGKLSWQKDSHETMSANEKSDVEKILGVTITPKGFQTKKTK